MRSIRRRTVSLTLCTVLFLFSCGQDQKPDYTNYYVNLAGVKVDWEGSVAADPLLKADFEATIDCMRQQDPDSIRDTTYPNVVVIDQPNFTCSGVDNVPACTGFLTDTIYISKEDLYTYVFTHEAIHWIAQVDNSQHYRSYFQCTYMVDTFYQ